MRISFQPFSVFFLSPVLCLLHDMDVLSISVLKNSLDTILAYY